MVCGECEGIVCGWGVASVEAVAGMEREGAGEWVEGMVGGKGG